MAACLLLKNFYRIIIFHLQLRGIELGEKGVKIKPTITQSVLHSLMWSVGDARPSSLLCLPISGYLLLPTLTAYQWVSPPPYSVCLSVGISSSLLSLPISGYLLLPTLTAYQWVSGEVCNTHRKYYSPHVAWASLSCVAVQLPQLLYTS